MIGERHYDSPFFVPTLNGPADWQKLLAGPEKHWRKGYSARTIAHCWESAKGFPPEIASLFSQSGVAAFEHVELLMAFPEHKVILPPPSGHPSQNDLFVIAKARDGKLVSITVEGKVAEAFGPTIGQWHAKPTPGKTLRLKSIKELLDLKGDPLSHIRYQLFHRTASAVIEAQRFNAPYAAIVVHSFSDADVGIQDYRNFVGLFDVWDAEPGKLVCLRELQSVRLYAGWAQGDPKFLNC